MPDLSFEVVGVEVPAFAAVPQLLFKLRVTNRPAEDTIASISLRSQIQIAVNRRHYRSEEQARLVELFGEPQRWSDTLRPLLWVHANAVVPPFSGSLLTDLPVACTYDFEVASTKFLDALADGEIPLTFLFSGTVFYEREDGHLQAAQIPWSCEAAYRLPVATWKEMLERYYPNSAWLRLPKDVFDRLYQYKTAHSLPTWEAAITRLLPDTPQVASASPIAALRREEQKKEGER